MYVLHGEANEMKVCTVFVRKYVVYLPLQEVVELLLLSFQMRGFCHWTAF